MKVKLFLLAIVAILAMPTSYAEEHVPQSVLDTASNFFPGFTIENASSSPIEGLYRITFGSNVAYVSANGRYAIRGDIIDLEKGINLTEIERNKGLTSKIREVDESTMIVFAPEDVKATISVFTDITCPYCAKLHQEVKKLNDNGIKVRYLAFPRSGIPSSVADDMASVWCANDPRQALTDAKAGFDISEERCANPVSDHYNLGVEIGIRGTPTIILEDGSTLGGYVPYPELTDAALQAHMAALQ